MALDIVCPTCESDEHLNGEPVGDGLLRLTCAACKVQWTRDPRPKCAICGGDDLYHLPQVILEKSRGNLVDNQTPGMAGKVMWLADKGLGVVDPILRKTRAAA